VIDSTRTTTVLLEGLFDPQNEAVWSEFDRRYRPIVLGFARKLGLSDADAADAAQETMTQFMKEYRAGKYDRQRGRLHSWLIGLAKFRIAMIRRAKSGRRITGGQTVMIDLSDGQRLTQVWDDERRRSILRQAMEELRTTTNLAEKTIRAFEMLAVNQMPAAAVAEELEVDIQEVYLAKSRVAQKLRSILERLESAYQEW
jgi:RNA polymerase sigma factor (sigma-70 family)